MKLQNLTVIFIIIIIPVILLVSLYITTGLKTLKYQSLYDTGLLTATHDAIFAFEQNTSNDQYSKNPEIKRDIVKSSIKLFEKSLANTCGISSYNVEEIERYIPAIVFGMYDGFYMYAPSKEYIGDNKYEYKHNLKNYVYYSETLDDGTVIRYSLDNYVVVTGKLKDIDGVEKYLTKGGYLAVGSSNNGKNYQGVAIEKENIDGHEEDGIKYYKEAFEFTNWFLNTAKIQDKKKNGETVKYLDIKVGNDPEDDNSAFVQHKRSIIKSKIEGVLNSSITAYSERTWDKVYKMPKLSDVDWERIYNNISMITFFQGKNIGLARYNGYCVLNSTNSKEYVNPNLMYFINGDYYHDIRCNHLLANQVSGYRIGSFEKRKEDIEVEKKDEEGNVIRNADGTAQTETVSRYKYDITSLACYDCINGPLQNNVSLYDYVRDNNTDDYIKISYFTSLGRERYNGSKPITYIPTQSEPESGDEEEKLSITIQKLWEDNDNANDTRPTSITVKLLANGNHKETIRFSESNHWEAIQLELDKYDAAGETITYRLEEDIPVGYESEIIYIGNTFTIINRLIQETNITVTLEKEWDDDNNAKNTRPDSIKVKIIGGEDSEVTLKASEDWKKTIELPKYDDANNEIHYTFEEIDVSNKYRSTVGGTGNTVKITNSLIRTTNVNVQKIWEDNDNARNTRPANVTVKLFANGIVKETVQLSESNGWKKTWENLAKYDGNEEIVYEVKEVNIPDDYNSVVNVTSDNNGDTYKITNTLIETVSVTVEKRWDDNNNAKGKRPASVAVKLLANGNERETIQLSASNSWKKTLNLPKFNGNEVITYSVEEIGTIPGYESPTYTTEGNKLIITNKYITVEDFNITLQTFGIKKGVLGKEKETKKSVSYSKEKIKIVAETNQSVSITLIVNGETYTSSSNTIQRYISGRGKYEITAMANFNGRTASASRTVYIGEESGNVEVKLGRVINGGKCLYSPKAGYRYIIMNRDFTEEYDLDPDSNVERYIGSIGYNPQDIEALGNPTYNYVEILPRHDDLSILSGKKIVMISPDGQSIKIIWGTD